jgi:hypothetical protein
MAKHDGKGGAHEGRPGPGNPGYRQDSANYEGRHKGGGICGLIALPALAGLGAVLLAAATRLRWAG